jgi:hypothetical protein
LRYEESLVLTPQAGALVRGGQALVDGTVWGSSSRLLVEFLLEHYELYAHNALFVAVIEDIISHFSEAALEVVVDVSIVVVVAKVVETVVAIELRL